MRGISDIFEKRGIKKIDVFNKMKEEDVPFSLNNYQNFSNLINGRTKPKDPQVYIWLSNELDVPLEDILMRFSDEKETSDSNPDKNNSASDNW